MGFSLRSSKRIKTTGTDTSYSCNVPLRNKGDDEYATLEQKRGIVRGCPNPPPSLVVVVVGVVQSPPRGRRH